MSLTSILKGEWLVPDFEVKLLAFASKVIMMDCIQGSTIMLRYLLV